jgi:hypothetical protein
MPCPGNGWNCAMFTYEFARANRNKDEQFYDTDLSNC